LPLSHPFVLVLGLFLTPVLAHFLHCPSAFLTKQRLLRVVFLLFRSTVFKDLGTLVFFECAGRAHFKHLPFFRPVLGVPRLKHLRLPITLSLVAT